VVELGKKMPRIGKPVSTQDLNWISAELARLVPEDPLQEVQRQNQELIRALEEVRAQREELARQREDLVKLNRELEDTNRGVVALYAELDEKADYLRRAYEVKSHFLSNMSHEFRTPLNSITTLGRMLLDRMDGDLTVEQERQVQFMLKSAESLMDLVNDLLDLAKVEAGKVAVRPVEFTVGNLFGALRGMLRPLTSYNQSVNLIFENISELPPMNTDEGKVSQVLRNFISNALKFTERGEVRVSAQQGPKDTILFSVADTGIGIAPEDQERIFQEYAQVDAAQRHRAKGTGLGLPLSKRLAELLGGGVSVKSAPGVGSTFYAMIPTVYQGPAEVSYVPEVTREMDPSRKPVLVVEDNRETLFIYEKYLKGTPFQVIPSRSLKEAKNTLRELRPLAVVLDILLENEYAWNFLAEIKADERTRDLPVFVVTMVDNRPKALSMGADDFCIKPCEREWLLSHLRAMTDERRAEKVLVIDDDEISRYLIRGMLEHMGLTVIEAEGGMAALELARRERPRAILLDLVMPDMDGFATLERLKADHATQEIPVLIHTSKVLEKEDYDRIGERANAILSKENSSRKRASERLREALCAAGLRLLDGGAEVTEEQPPVSGKASQSKIG
jgi:signal transduction histidine kinase/CheY-like chemotaxis protein